MLIVALSKQKLEKLLQLPPTFKIRKAKVLLLRVTIPVDFYTSPITAEVDGVDVRLKVSSKPDTGDRSRRKGKSKDDPGVGLSPADLAQSFLEAQPSSEKKQLEAAIAAETQDLGASVAVSDAGSDDDGLAYGTGQGLSLPAFLTDFLQAVIDRIQVVIRGVNFQLDVELPTDSNPNAPELVTFELAIEAVNVEGVTAPVLDEDQPTKLAPKEGKRHVALKSIRGFLISEANVFSTLARSASAPSSSASHSPVLTDHQRPFSRQPTAMDLAMTSSSGSSGQSITDSEILAQSQYALQGSQDTFDIPYDLRSQGEDAGDEEPPSSLSTPRASIYQDIPPRLSPGDYAHSEMVQPQKAPWGSSLREAQSEPCLALPGETQLPRASDPLPGPEADQDTRSEGSTSSGEDLTQSHLYSHEDAESMYMSAFSAADSVRFRSSMPGAWDTEHPPNPEQKRSATPPDAEGHPPATPSAPELSVDGSPTSDVAQSFARLAVDESPVEPDTGRAEESTTSGPGVFTAEAQSPQDDVPTPRGPTRLVKEFMSLASMSVYIPSNHKHLQVESPHLGKSVSSHMPGAFSVHSAASTIPALPTQTADPGDGPVDKSCEVILAPLEIRFDASFGFLLAMVVPKLLEAFKGRQEASATQTSEGAPRTAAVSDFRLVAESISLLFLDKLAGVADTAERAFMPRGAEFGTDVLLKMDVGGVAASAATTSSEQTDLAVNIEKLTFGYANEPIIAFDRSVNMFESVMNTFPAAGNDISVKVSHSADDMRCNVDTLPLHVNLDLQRLDEAFSWFGGLSSFLSMGSSMTSSASVSGGAGKGLARGTQKRRGVRFDAPVSPDDQSASKENKVAMRINGFRLDLIGKGCTVVLDTSAVKFVSREEAIGVHISRSRLSGPYLRDSRRDAPIVADVLNMRLEYLGTPRNTDLERLLELITPSKVKFDENDDEIMVDTLLRQRRKGAVLRVGLDKVKVAVSKVQQLDCLPALGEELARLGTVAKYLPEDDRPGLLTLALVKSADMSLDIGGRFGVVNASLRDLDLGLITLPSLVAVALDGLTVDRNEIEELVHTAKVQKPGSSQSAPVLMMRMVDSIEPVVKVRLMGLGIEYRVPTVMDLLGLAADATPQDFEASLAASVANLGDHAHSALKGKGKQVVGHVRSGGVKAETARPIHVDLTFRDCLIGLNPLGLTSKLVVVLTDANLDIAPPKDNKIGIIANLKKTSALLIDDLSLLDSETSVTNRRRPTDASSPQVVALCSKGFVDICQISSAKASVRISKGPGREQHVDVDVRDDLLVIETCADSTQTLITLANALTPPTPPSKEVKYKTSVVPVNDLLASLTSDAFGKAEGDYDFDNDFGMAQELASETDGGDDDFYGGGGPSHSPLQLDSQYYEEDDANEELFDAGALSMTSDRTTAQDTADGVLLTSSSTRDVADDSSDDLHIQDNYFGTASVFDGTAHRWNSAKNTYDRSNDRKVLRGPLKVCIRDVHVIWNLFDGYDWLRTRDVITKAVQEVETKAHERRSRSDRRTAFEQDFEEDETVIGDFLFNSIYIGIPANRDPAELARAINQELNDNATETESIATTALTATPSRVGGTRAKPKKLKLGRSRHHKVTFELKGLNVDLVTLPPGSGETKSSVDVRVKDLDIFDHVPTSTWKKFAMYDQDAGEREMGSSMVHLELLTVQPVPSLPASEIVLKATVLPLRLHVDQDALDFITRFFEFKDDSAPVHASPSDVPFIQRAEINSIPVKLDFKPKRVDYAGLRSGHTTEFMNFLILEDARMVLRHTIIYGVSGFDRLGKTLNDIWMPEIKRNQLPGILAGLAPVRGIVNVGSGVRDLIEIPIKEYRKDGRIVRSIGKGAAAFARTTGTEMVKLGAKLAIGTQYVLQGAEGMLVKDPQEGSSSAGAAGADSEDDEDCADGREKKQISLYADQPAGVIQGLRGAYSSLSRDLYVARDAIIAVPGEVMDSQGAQGAAKALLKRAPTIIFRPAIGATRALGQTLLGATNTLDPENRRRMDAVSLLFLSGETEKCLLTLDRNIRNTRFGGGRTSSKTRRTATHITMPDGRQLSLLLVY